VKIRAGGGEALARTNSEPEYADFGSGGLQLPNPTALEPSRFGGYQQHLLASATPVPRTLACGEEPVTTFIIERREYVNLYHTLIEIFNTYVAIQLIAPDEPFNLLWLDGHCQGGLDPLWTNILQPASILRLHEYPRDQTRFQQLVLVPSGYDSPLYNTGRIRASNDGDLLVDFVETVLAAYPADDRPNHDPVLTFVDRRDYKPHPHSDGRVDRKVANLERTIELLKRQYPMHQVQAHCLEKLSFGQQIRIVRKSDVLCGVHGAGLTHVLFMRPNCELVEFRPQAYRRNQIFENLAKLRTIRYRSYFAQTTQTLPGGQVVVEPTTKRC